MKNIFDKYFSGELLKFKNKLLKTVLVSTFQKKEFQFWKLCAGWLK